MLTARESEKDYYNTILSILNETAQLLLDMQLLRQKGLQTIDMHISVLENYLKDPYFKSVKTEVSAVYLFEDLQKSYQDLVSIKEKANQQKDQLAVLKKEREEAKNEIIGTTKELKEKERERANFSEGHRDHAGLGGDSITARCKHGEARGSAKNERRFRRHELAVRNIRLNILGRELPIHKRFYSHIKSSAVPCS